MRDLDYLSRLLRVVDRISGKPRSVYAHSAVFTPAVNKFRFYEDGTEAGATATAAEDTNITRDLTGGDSSLQLRVRIQEGGGAAGATTDDYTLQYSINSSGTWVSVTASTAYVKANTGSALTDGGVTTNRLTAGTGSFVAGEQEEANGTVEDRQLTASNFTEHVWAITIVRANLYDGDTIDFRVSLNGGAPGMTNSVTPRITINDDDNGYDQIGGTLWTPGDIMLGCRIKSGTSISAGAVSVYCRKTGGGSALAKALIYSDSSGPATLLGTSNEITLSSVLGWQDFTFATPVSLTAGTNYWLAIFIASAGVDMYYDVGNSNVSFFTGGLTYPTAPDPMTTETLEAKRASMYAWTGPTTGVLAATMQRATFSGTGNMAPSGVMASTMQRALASLTGQHGQTGVITASLIAATFAGNGSQTHTGILASILQAALFSGTGAQTHSGQVAGTLRPATFAGEGIAGVLFTGTIASTLQMATFTAQGMADLVGVITAILSASTFSGSGSQEHSGSIQATLQAAVASLSGVQQEFYTGIMAAVMQANLFSGSGNIPNSGILAATLQQLQFAAVLVMMGIPIELAAHYSTGIVSSAEYKSDIQMLASRAADILNIADKAPDIIQMGGYDNGL